MYPLVQSARLNTLSLPKSIAYVKFAPDRFNIIMNINIIILKHIFIIILHIADIYIYIYIYICL